MPFGPNGTYTPPTGAENAAPGNVIRSVTWNTIFTDLSTALSQLGQATWVAAPRVVPSGSFTVAPTDSVILVQGSSPTITLPLSSTKQGVVRIFGNAGNIFGSANALVIATSPETISGVGTVALTTNFQTIALYPLASGGYLRY